MNKKCWYCKNKYEPVWEGRNTACIKCLRFPIDQSKEKQSLNISNKKMRSGLRKCPGHKQKSHYDDNGQCDRCGGYKKEESYSISLSFSMEIEETQE